MNQDGKNPMLENAPRETLAEALNKPDLPAPAEKRPPPGTVERILNFKDRNYIVGACTAYCEQDGHRTIKNHRKLSQVRELVNFRATEEHTDELNDVLTEEILKWEGARERYRTWRRYQEGLLSADELEQKHPEIDLEKGVEKPPIHAPRIEPKDARGPESAFHFPAKLDAWVQDALYAMEWPTLMTEFAVELCDKYGIEDEPDREKRG